ncbi:MAG: alpha/beta hydrolase [Candidatus Obscuribacterales bacterium]|nr:alpha/beta hydrolase [Candidatus Obscuribacterales bacterium]
MRLIVDKTRTRSFDSLFRLLLIMLMALPVYAYSAEEIPVFFVSDRKPEKSTKEESAQDQLIAGQHLKFGVANVSFTDGDSSAPRKSKNFSVCEQQSISMNFGAAKAKPVNSSLFTDEFLGRFREFLNKSNSRSFILYIHGCCMSEKLSFCSAGELAESTQLPVLIFDWASPGVAEAPLAPEFNSYRRSERVLEISQHNIHDLFSAIATHLPDYKMIVVAHSMGNRLILNELNRQSANNLQIEQLHLVRPDLSLPAYLLDEEHYCSLAKQVYIYLANNDAWLKISQSFSADVPRLGSPDKFLNIAIKHGMSLDSPSNRYFLDISPLKLSHDIPYELVDSVIARGATEGSESFIFEAQKLTVPSEKFLLVKKAKSSKSLIEHANACYVETKTTKFDEQTEKKGESDSNNRNSGRI